MHSERTPRRRHSAEHKAQVLAECDAAGASIAAVAQSHGLNTNLVHKWRRAQRHPTTITYGSGGNGSSQHLYSSLLKKVANIDITHVPYKGSGPALTDLMAGQVDFILDTGSLGHVQGGNLKALAVASAKRIPALPDVPTFAELGYKDMIASAWYGVLALAGLPKPFQDKLNTEVNAVLKDPEVRKQIEMKLGGVVSDGESPAWFGDFIKTELKRYAEIVKISGAKAE